MPPDAQVQEGGPEGWTREQIERVWDVFAHLGYAFDRESMYHDEGADSAFCENHRDRLARTLNQAEVVPRDVAERLAEALAAAGDLAEINTEDWTGDHSTALNEALKTLTEFRAAFPKAEEA